MRIFYVAALMALIGCGDKAVDGFDGLTSSARNSGASAKPVNLVYPLQTRFLAANGKLPILNAGSACVASSARPSNTIVCLAPEGNTVLVEHLYDAKADFAALVALRDKFQGLASETEQLRAAAEAAVCKDGDTDCKTQTASTIAQVTANLNQKTQELETALNEKNVFVFRWSESAAGNLGGTIQGDAASGRTTARRGEGGLVLVSGLKYSQLLIGSDFERIVADFPKSAKIATVAMQAEHLIYFAQAERSASASVNLDIAELRSISPSLATSVEAAIDAAASIADVQEVQGGFSEPKYTTVTNWRTLSGQADSGFQTFYATMTDVETLKRSLSKN